MIHNTIGVFFGKYAPLHNGHINAIIKASYECSHLYVVMCWDQKFQSTLSPRMKRICSLNNRLKYLHSTFGSIKNITIKYVDESSIPSYPDGYTEFGELLRKAVPCAVDMFFTSEPQYNAFLNQEFPDAKHVIIDAPRLRYPVSATDIRTRSTEEIWQFIPPAVRSEMALRVAIIGIESTGKSTATALLEKEFNTCSVEEVGRTLCEQEMYSSEFTMSEFDYIRIATEHRHKENLLASKCNKVLLSDTNNFITYYSAKEMGIESKVLQEMSLLEHYDLILFLDNNVPWVYDPLRRKGSTQDRQTDEARLMDSFSTIRKMRSVDYNVKYICADTYKKRISLCKEQIKLLLKQPQRNLN